MRCKSLGAAGFALALAACSSPAAGPAPSSSPSAAPPVPAAHATEVPVHIVGTGNATTPTVLTDTKHGRKVYTIRALVFEGDIGGSTDGVATLDQPHVTFVDKTGSVTIADAPKATVMQRDKSILMTGGVHARTQDGAVLTCDTLRYDANRERLYGEGHVVLTGPNGLALNGDHLDGDVRLHDVKVTSG